MHPRMLQYRLSSFLVHQKPLLLPLLLQLLWTLQLPLLRLRLLEWSLLERQSRKPLYQSSSHQQQIL
jgi:hypothetical protein